MSFPSGQIFSWVKDFVRGAKRLCLTIKDNHLVWDLQFILESLQQAPFKPLSSTSLAWLLGKQLFLSQLPQLGELVNSRLFSVSDRYLQITPRGVRMQLNLVFIPKVNSVANRDGHIFLEPFCPRASSPAGCTLHFICPCRAILKYVSVTKVSQDRSALCLLRWRSNERSQHPKPLFLVGSAGVFLRLTMFEIVFHLKVSKLINVVVSLPRGLNLITPHWTTYSDQPHGQVLVPLLLSISWT